MVSVNDPPTERYYAQQVVGYEFCTPLFISESDLARYLRARYDDQEIRNFFNIYKLIQWQTKTTS